jgi:protein-disulfide isomerase
MNNQNESMPEIEETINVEAPKKDRFLPISIIVAAILICGAILFAALYHPSSSPTAQTGTGGSQQQQPAASLTNVAKLGSRDAVLGNSNAPVTVIEYGDYQCPFCTRYFSQIQPLIKQNYIDTGKVKMVFRDFPFLGAESLAAAEAAQCANDQGKLWAYHDALYAAKSADETKGGGENDGFFTRAEFLTLANQTGLSAGTFTSCIDGAQHASDIQTETSTAVSAGIVSTPTTVVNGKLVADQTGSSLGANATAIFQFIDSAVSGK